MPVNIVCKSCNSRPERMPFMLRSFLVRNNKAIAEEVNLCSYRCIIQYAGKMMFFKSCEVFQKITLPGILNGKSKQTRSRWSFRASNGFSGAYVPGWSVHDHPSPRWRLRWERCPVAGQLGMAQGLFPKRKKLKLSKGGRLRSSHPLKSGTRTCVVG